MRVTVVGLGHVGSVIAACLAESNHQVDAVDVDLAKVQQVNQGRAPVLELGLAELVASNVRKGRLSATTDLAESVRRSDVVFLCVGTPSDASGDVDLGAIRVATDQIGTALRGSGWTLVLIASTMPPGGTAEVVIPLLEAASGKTCGTDFGVAYSPEFLREGSAIADFRQQPKTVIAGSDEAALARAVEIFRPYSPAVAVTSMEVAEVVKLASNAWHAVKVSFANEIGRICSPLGIDSHAVMEIFTADTRLNVASSYLTPGFAFGGPCLVKDVRALRERAHGLGAVTPVLDAVLPSNEAQIDAAVARITACKAFRVAVLGLAFKAGTADLRGSPSLILIQRLLDLQLDVVVHDEQVEAATQDHLRREAGSGELALLQRLRFARLDEAVKQADIVVVAQANSAYAHVVDAACAGQAVIDLTGVARPPQPVANYSGMSW
jgi:GDP-mannose 6-dehydrogenase